MAITEITDFLVIGAGIAGLRAALFSLASGRRPTVDHIIQDEEMFI